jgi:hypothetical protein
LYPPPENNDEADDIDENITNVKPKMPLEEPSYPIS